MLKKLSSLFLALLLISLCACGTAAPAPEETAQPAPDAELFYGLWRSNLVRYEESEQRPHPQTLLLEFKKDGTFACLLNDGLEGTWAIEPEGDQAPIEGYLLNLEFSFEGEGHSIHSSINMDGDSLSFILNMGGEGWFYNFDSKDGHWSGDKAEEVKELILPQPEKLVSDWQCVSLVQSFYDRDGNYQSGPADSDGYSIRFESDGSFEALLSGGTFHGTWELRDKAIMGLVPICYYTLYPENSDAAMEADMSLVNTGDGYMQLTLSVKSETLSESYKFIYAIKEEQK